MIVGTLPYMAPEQVEGKAADARTDVWAFGTILYEMLTGKRAFGGGSAASLIGHIMHGEPPALTSVLPLTPPAVDRLVRKCLAKDPEARWQAASDVADELRWLTSGSGLASGAGAAVTPRARRPRRWILAAGALVVVLAAAALWVWRAAPGRALPPPSLVQVTSSPGTEQHPALSPDGAQVAFSRGEHEGNADIYVQTIGDTEARRLTTDPLADMHPCWSPDGKQLAFVRVGTGGQTAAIYRMSANGGSEWKLKELSNLSEPYYGVGLSWSPDGKWLAVARDRPAGSMSDEAGIYLVAVEGGEQRRVTTPRAPAIHMSPSFSSNGRSLAFIEANLVDFVCDVFIQRLSSEGQPEGTPQQITRTRWGMLTLAWHADGRSVIVSASSDLADERLYRVSIDGHGTPEPIEVAGLKARFPTTSRIGNRLVFARTQWDADIYRLHPGRGAPEPLIKTSREEFAPQYSPDGRQVAFTSNRTEGRTEIWVADADGSNQSRLTHGPGRNQVMACWSPDGRWIAFASQDDAGQFDIYVVDPSGVQRRRITTWPSNESYPSFSHDGQWIYFTSTRTGRNEVFRAPVAGGEPEQLTTEGGSFPLESGDEKTLVYLKTTGELFAKPLAGGPERRLASTVAAEIMFAVAENRVYYWGNRSTDRGWPLLFYDLLSQTSGEVARVAVTWEQIMQGLTVSPDRQTILFAANELHPGMDLWLIENFR